MRIAATAFRNGSLRLRLVLCVGLVLALSVLVGCGLMGVHAAASVRNEMQAALAAAQAAVANGLEEMDGSPAANRELRRLVASFSGHRHVQARLTDATGAAIAVSLPQPHEGAVPGWFARAIAPQVPAIVVPTPAGGAVTLTADPGNELTEVWNQAGDAARVLAVFFGLTVVLIQWVAGRALHPLVRVSEAFARVGAGDYGTRLVVDGPPELARLAAGFNQMTHQLGEMGARNNHLQEQLLRLQDEERADLARDLHDEVGPLLFVAGIDAASVAGLVSAGRAAEAAARVDSIRQSITRIQTHIRAILGRLRPLTFGAVGLAEAIGNLVEFWRSRHPEIAFSIDLVQAEEALADRLRATICRVVQESLYNAVRHGQPTRIEVSVTRADGQIVVRVSDDGVGVASGALAAGFGLTGMRERVRAQSGSLTITGQDLGRGLSVTAHLPYETAA